MYNEGFSYTDALKIAREPGFAKSNPHLNVEGLNALSKLVIITVHAFGWFVRQDEIFHFAILLQAIYVWQRCGSLSHRFSSFIGHYGKGIQLPL